MRRIVMATALVAVALLTLGAAEEPPVQEGTVKWSQVAIGNGEVLYAQLCATCHGVEAKGDGPAAPALAVPPPNLTLLAKMDGGEFPTEEVERSISGDGRILAHGGPGMPMWGPALEAVRPDFKPARREWFANQRIKSLAAYLETIQE